VLYNVTWEGVVFCYRICGICGLTGGLGRLSAWNLPGGPSNVEGGCGTEEEAQGPLAREGFTWINYLQ